MKPLILNNSNFHITIRQMDNIPLYVLGIYERTSFKEFKMEEATPLVELTLFLSEINQMINSLNIAAQVLEHNE